MMQLSRALKLKHPKICQKTWHSDFSARQRSATCYKSRQGKFEEEGGGFQSLKKTTKYPRDYKRKLQILSCAHL